MFNLNVQKNEASFSSRVTNLLHAMKRVVEVNELVVIALEKNSGPLATDWQDELQDGYNKYLKTLERALVDAIRMDMADALSPAEE